MKIRRKRISLVAPLMNEATMDIYHGYTLLDRLISSPEYRDAFTDQEARIVQIRIARIRREQEALSKIHHRLRQTP